MSIRGASGLPIETPATQIKARVARGDPRHGRSDDYNLVAGTDIKISVAREKQQIQHAICIEKPTYFRRTLSAADLEAALGVASRALSNPTKIKADVSRYADGLVYTANGIREAHRGQVFRFDRARAEYNGGRLADGGHVFEQAATTADPERQEQIAPDPVFAPDWTDAAPMPKGALGEIVDDDGDCGSDDDLSGEPDGFEIGYPKAARKPRRSKRNIARRLVRNPCDLFAKRSDLVMDSDTLAVRRLGRARQGR